MNQIRILSEKVATQIAAGEVIERPASVIRELVDNSIDAGSDDLVIDLEDGGKRLLRVADNGQGMGRDDLLLSVERYATSKIQSLSDLFSLKSLGFRGEALPSIASVSRMEITSRPRDQLVGHRLKVDAGRLVSVEETGSPPGTIVEVRNLFFNTPARRKFLRAARTETGGIIDTLSRIILPFIRVRLKVDEAGKTILNLPAAQDERNRLSGLLGRDVAQPMAEVSEEAGDFSIRAYLAPEEQSRNRGDRIFIYVNRRNIRDRLITRAVMEGYGQRLMRGRYPQAVIFIAIDPSQVDVNVHPTKQEVRFRNGRRIFETLVSAIERALKGPSRSFKDTGSLKDVRPGRGQEGFLQAAEPPWEYSGPPGDKAPPRPGMEPQAPGLEERGPRVIGQLNDTYILCQARDGLLLVDQHAAHERIVYESLLASYRSSQMQTQPFLIPPRLEVSSSEGRVVLEKRDKLAGLGLELEHFGGSAFLLRSVPSILINSAWDRFFLDLIPVLKEERDLDQESALSRVLTVMACHGAIRAGQRMSGEEMAALLAQLEGTDLPTHCPHGRPIAKKFSYYEIEKMFKRVA